MSSAPSALPQELEASREDFELFRRLMRVARLMELQDNSNILGNPEPPLTAITQHIYPGGELFPFDEDTLLQHGNVLTLSAEDNYNYDDEDDEDDDDEERTRQDSLLDPQLFRPFVDQNHPATPQSIRSTPRSRRRSIKTPTQRQTQDEENQQPKRQKATQQDPPEQRPHAAVEKKYRSVINSKIKQLNDLVPPSNTYSTPGDGKQLAERETGEEDKVPTKAVVLDRALQYINSLVATYEKYEKERNDIHGRLKIWLEEFDTVGVSDTREA